MIVASEIEFQNLSKFLDLKVSEAQSKYVAPNAVTIAQYHYEPSGWVRGLFDGDAAVGLLAMINPSIPSPSFEEGDPDDGGFMWRLMIGEGFQGKGYGRQAVEIAKALCRDWGYTRLYTSAVPGDITPVPFYESCGLRQTGRMLGSEIELVADL